MYLSTRRFYSLRAVCVHYCGGFVQRCPFGEFEGVIDTYYVTVRKDEEGLKCLVGGTISKYRVLYY